MTQTTTPAMHLLLHAPIRTMLWRLAAPNVLAVTLMTCVTFADALFVGFLGTSALASLALVFPFQTLMQMMAGGAIGGGITSSVARALGGGDNSNAERAAWHAVVIACVMAAFYILVLGLFSKPIFELMGGSGEVLEGAVDYARLAFGGALAVWASFTLSAILRGTGDTATPARAIIVSSAAQLPLSAVLTLGWGGLPSIGVAGPAAAMVLCHSAAAVYLALYVLRGRARIRLRPHSIRWLSILDIMRVGGLGCVNSLTIALTVVVVTGFVGQYGTAALAGYGLGSRLELMLIPIAFGLGAALTAAVGTNFGAGQFARARRAAWLGAGLTFAITTVLGVGAALMPSLWLDGFTTDPEVFAYGALYLLIVAPFYGLFCAGQTLYFASQGTGRMLAPVLVGVTRLLVVCSVGACALALSWEVNAVFAAVAAGLTTIGLGLGLCMFTRAWCPDAAT